MIVAGGAPVKRLIRFVDAEQGGHEADQAFHRSTSRNNHNRSLVVVAPDPLRNQGRFFRAFDLDHGVPGHLHAVALQWIHVDPARAKDSPFGGTIAHGFLTLSLLSRLSEMTFLFSDRKMGVNYGLNRVRFTSPVPAGSRVRARFTLFRFEKIENNGVQVTWNVTIERDGAAKPALVAEWVGRHYY